MNDSNIFDFAYKQGQRVIAPKRHSRRALDLSVKHGPELNEDFNNPNRQGTMHEYPKENDDTDT